MNILFAHRRADKAEDFHHNRGRRAGGHDRIGHDKGAHIDKGIARDAGVAFQLQDRVESQTRGLAANTGPEPVAKAAERDGEGKELGDRLEPKGFVGVAGRQTFAAGQGQSNGKARRVDAVKFGDIARDGAAVRGGGHFLGDLVEQDLQIQGLKASS